MLQVIFTFYHQVGLQRISYNHNQLMKAATPEEITAQFHLRGVLLMLDAPENLEFGIDNISWRVGNKFKGVKLIPLGTHIITYSLRNENYMFPIKKFIYFGPTNKEVKDDERIRVFRWSTKSQRFVMLRGEQAEGYRDGVKKYHFDCYLGPYPDQNIEFWSANTRYITKQVLDKLDPIEYYQDYAEQYTNKQEQNKNQQPNIDQQSEQDIQQSNQLQKQMEEIVIQQNQQKLNSGNMNGRQKQKQKEQNSETNQIKKNKDFGGNIYYSEVPRRLTSSSAHTSQINMDRTPILESILKASWPKNEMNFLGEIQYSFISFLVGQCLDSYTQWKQCMVLFSSSETAFSTHKNLMLEFIAVLYEQLKQFPEDFFIDELAKDSFLTGCLKNLNTYYIEKTINKKALNRIERLMILVSEKFNYQPIQQEEEQSPVIVGEDESYF